jgi:hypothetical protein
MATTLRGAARTLAANSRQGSAHGIHIKSQLQYHTPILYVILFRTLRGSFFFQVISFANQVRKYEAVEV